MREAKTVDSESEDDILQTDRLYAMADNIGDMTVDQKMVAAVQEFIEIHGVGYVATKSELHDFIHDRYKIASGSIIPSDYCYNRQFLQQFDSQDFTEATPMKKHFMVSLVKNGIIGGGIVADSEGITFHTGKLTIPQEYRHLAMKYEDISDATKGWLFILPTVTIRMRNGNEYKFAVFFSRKRFIDTLIGMGVGV